jgi:hypothetical protein
MHLLEQPRPVSHSRRWPLSVRGRLRGERLCGASAGRSSPQARDEARGHCPLHSHAAFNTPPPVGIPDADMTLTQRRQRPRSTPVDAHHDAIAWLTDGLNGKPVASACGPLPTQPRPRRLRRHAPRSRGGGGRGPHERPAVTLARKTTVCSALPPSPLRRGHAELIRRPLPGTGCLTVRLARRLGRVRAIEALSS